MLSSNDITILKEMRRELEGMRKRVAVASKEGIDGRDGTLQRTLAHMLLNHLDYIAEGIYSFQLFADHCRAGLEMVDTMRRIMEGTTEWEALTRTKPEERYDPPRWDKFVGVDFGGEKPSFTSYTGYEGEHVLFYPDAFQNAIKLADEEIEEGILLGSLVRTYKMGSWVKCSICGNVCMILVDGLMPDHDTSSKMSCINSGATLNASTGKPVSHAEIKFPQYLPPDYPRANPAEQVVEGKTYFAVECPSGVSADTVIEVAKACGIEDAIEYKQYKHSLKKQGSVVTFGVPSSVFSTVMIDNFKQRVITELAVVLNKFFYAETRTKAYNDLIRSSLQESDPQLPRTKEPESPMQLPRKHEDKS